MKIILKSLLISILTTAILVLLTNLLIENSIHTVKLIDENGHWGNDNFLAFVPFTFSSVFVGIYYSCKIKDFFTGLTKSIIVSLIFNFLLIFIFTFYVGEWELISFRLIVFTILIILFITLIAYLISSLSKIRERRINNIKRTTFLSYFIITIIYELILLLWVYKINSYSIIVHTTFVGAIVFFLSFYFFEKIEYLEKKNTLIILFYFSTLIILPLIDINFSSFTFLAKETILVSILIKGLYYTAIVLIVHLNYIFKKNQQEKEQLQQQSLQSQLNYQQLKSQLSPHFLFNNINVLTSLIEENPKQAILFSSKLSDIYRYFLEYEKSDVVSVNEELIFIYNYLDLLAIRFEEGLSYSIEVSNKVKEMYLVPTAMQQILENVIKHNEINKDKPVLITISSNDEYLLIENNKNNKISKERSHKKGIANIKQRYSYFTDNKVIIENGENKFIIKLPLLTE
ncbi:histidine kinase [uncultured Tenacibaculum sp.]|uniref:sensor histidine kinase n=1 Tax=uncultured Tenacibaculum sp. TaxID=174713 RepID=UPI0026376C62|nr:histidine kinase [uncultured Tenacibaculum sp.]